MKVIYKVIAADTEMFEKSRNEWNHLVSAMKRPVIFCTWEWIYTWWECFGKDYRLLVLFVYKQAEIVGILPLVFHKRAGNDLLRVRVLSYCGTVELYPDHLDLICSDSESEPCMNAIFDFLSSEYKDWDLLCLNNLAEGANLLSWLNRKKPPFGFETRQSAVAPFIPISGSFEEYITRIFSGKERYNIRKKRKRLYEQHGVRYASYDPSQDYEALESLFDLHERRAISKKIVSTFRGHDLLGFHHRLLQKINKDDGAWLRSLRNEKEVIAVFYGFAIGKRLLYYQMGFDPDWEHNSPGMVLFYEVINEAFSKGYLEFDFLEGDEEFKYRWTKQQRILLTANIYNKTIRGILARNVYRLRTFVKRIIKKAG